MHTMWADISQLSSHMVSSDIAWFNRKAEKRDLLVFTISKTINLK